MSKAKEEGRVPAGKYLIRANTPSYVGSHVTGFANMVKGIVEAFPVNTGHKTNTINIIPGYVEPSDMAEIKKIASDMGLDAIVFPDTSGVLNGPQTGKYEMYPSGGAKIPDLIRAGDSAATIALGPIASGPGAKALDAKCKVPCEILKLPIGIKATDEFVDRLRILGGVNVPENIIMERGQAIDVITDSQQYFAGKKAALIGDPDQLVSLAGFLSDIGMKVRHVVTGTAGKKFEQRIKDAVGDDVNVKEASDFFYFHQLIKNEKVDIIFGNTYSKYIARDEDIPLIRFGFPIYDRTGHQYMPTVGYTGAMRLLEKILSAILDRQDRDAAEEKFELVM
jgi:nitrogenase molybdenum-iron protein beta chain